MHGPAISALRAEREFEAWRHPGLDDATQHPLGDGAVASWSAISFNAGMPRELLVLAAAMLVECLAVDARNVQFSRGR